MQRLLALPRTRARWTLPVLLLACAGLLGGAALGPLPYAPTSWLYRGFAPPHDPAYVRRLGDVGTTQRFYVASRALGGRRQPVDVYLPPGYGRDSRRRYPVLYLLHGAPGRPGAFLQ